MESRDKKQVVLACGCGRVRYKSSWYFPPQKQLDRIKNDGGKTIKLIGSVCPSCQR